MDADTWDTTDDWPAILAAVPDVPGRRKLRLWCVAWARLVLDRAAGTTLPPLRDFLPGSVAAFGREVDAAEAFADGRIGRADLHAAKNPNSGGPQNVFRLASGITRLTPARITPNLTAFARWHAVPTARQLADLLRDVFGNPFRPVAFDPDWRTATTVAVARSMYEARDFAPMPVLADALEDAGCTDRAVIGHCRSPGPHVRGCWVVDEVLGLK